MQWMSPWSCLKWPIATVLKVSQLLTACPRLAPLGGQPVFCSLTLAPLPILFTNHNQLTPNRSQGKGVLHMSIFLFLSFYSAWNSCSLFSSSLGLMAHPVPSSLPDVLLGSLLFPLCCCSAWYLLPLQHVGNLSRNYCLHCVSPPSLWLPAGISSCPSITSWGIWTLVDTGCEVGQGNTWKTYAGLQLPHGFHACDPTERNYFRSKVGVWCSRLFHGLGPKRIVNSFSLLGNFSRTVEYLSRQIISSYLVILLSSSLPDSGKY